MLILGASMRGSRHLHDPRPAPDTAEATLEVGQRPEVTLKIVQEASAGVRRAEAQHEMCLDNLRLVGRLLLRLRSDCPKLKIADLGESQRDLGTKDTKHGVRNELTCSV